MKRNLFFITVASLFIWATFASAAEETSVFDQFEAVIALEKKEVKSLIEEHKDDDADKLVKALSESGLVSIGGAFVITQSSMRVREIEEEVANMSLSAEKKLEELTKQIDQVEEEQYQKLLEINPDMLPKKQHEFLQTWIEEYRQHQEEKEEKKQERPFIEIDESAMDESSMEDDADSDDASVQIAEVIQRMVENPTKADQEELEQVLEDAGIQKIIEEHDDDNNEAALAAKLIAAGVGVGAVALLVKNAYDRKKKAGKVNIKKQMLSERLVARGQKEVKIEADRKPPVLSEEYKKSAASLGLDPDAPMTEKDIKKKYVEAMFADHPDKGGPGTRTKELMDARKNLLNSPELKQNQAREETLFNEEKEQVKKADTSEPRYRRESVSEMDREQVTSDQDQEKNFQSKRDNAESDRERSGNKEVFGRDSEDGKRRIVQSGETKDSFTLLKKRRGLLEKLKDRKKKVIVKGREKKRKASTSVRSIRSRVKQVRTNMQNKKPYRFKK
ncbi:hypothetical protein JKY79_00085 [Candidatus Babeliales bacterium]|nr:hypothetical protein [Candidatus Babeliales bacterium]